jgi:Cdc6-like AAA superfamily ATPase
MGSYTDNSLGCHATNTLRQFCKKLLKYLVTEQVITERSRNIEAIKLFRKNRIDLARSIVIILDLELRKVNHVNPKYCHQYLILLLQKIGLIDKC